MTQSTTHKLDRKTTELIALRSRIALTESEIESFTNSLEKIITLLDQVNSVEVCDYKDYSIKPIACEDLQKDEVKTFASPEKVKTACSYLDKESNLINFPRVIENDN